MTLRSIAALALALAVAGCASTSTPARPPTTPPPTQSSTLEPSGPAEEPRAPLDPPSAATDLSPEVFPIEPDGAGDSAASGDAPDLNDYGRDPAHRRPAPAPVVPTAAENMVMDELERMARVFARDLPRDRLLAKLGTPITDPAAPQVSLKPRSPHVAELHARVGGSSYEEIAIALQQPIKVEVLMTRYGTFVNPLTHTREEDFVEYVADIFASRRYRVSLAVRAGHLTARDLPKASVGSVFLHRARNR